jgi:CheY-like chemotaxis protein
MAKKILVAEDGKATREVLTFILSNRGFEIVEAVTGVEALKSAKEIHPDVIIMDSELPEMSGYEVFRALKEDPDCKRIPVFLLVADTDLFDMPTRSIPPAQFLISKPFKAHDLVQRVEKSLS